MTNKEFIKQISKKHNIPQTTLTQYFDLIELELKEALCQLPQGEKLKVCDLNFEIKTQDGKIARNPKTNETVWVEPMKKMRVYLSSDWKRLFKII